MFHNTNPQHDKGLFTFYREQAQIEQKLRNQQKSQSKQKGVNSLSKHIAKLYDREQYTKLSQERQGYTNLRKKQTNNPSSQLSNRTVTEKDKRLSEIFLNHINRNKSYNVSKSKMKEQSSQNQPRQKSINGQIGSSVIIIRRGKGQKDLLQINNQMKKVRNKQHFNTRYGEMEGHFIKKQQIHFSNQKESNLPYQNDQGESKDSLRQPTKMSFNFNAKYKHSKSQTEIEYPSPQRIHIDCNLDPEKLIKFDKQKVYKNHLQLPSIHQLKLELEDSPSKLHLTPKELHFREQKVWNKKKSPSKSYSIYFQSLKTKLSRNFSHDTEAEISQCKQRLLGYKNLQNSYLVQTPLVNSQSLLKHSSFLSKQGSEKIQSTGPWLINFSNYEGENQEMMGSERLNQRQNRLIRKGTIDRLKIKILWEFHNIQHCLVEKKLQKCRLFQKITPNRSSLGTQLQQNYKNQHPWMILCVCELSITCYFCLFLSFRAYLFGHFSLISVYP